MEIENDIIISQKELSDTYTRLKTLGNEVLDQQPARILAYRYANSKYRYSINNADPTDAQTIEMFVTEIQRWFKVLFQSERVNWELMEKEIKNDSHRFFAIEDEDMQKQGMSLLNIAVSLNQ